MPGMLPSLLTRRQAMIRMAAMALAAPGRDTLLDELVQSGFLYFWEAADPTVR